MTNFKQELKAMQQCLLDTFDGKFDFSYLRDYDITIIKGLDYNIVKDNWHFGQTKYDNTFWRGKCDVCEFTDFLLARIKMLHFIISKEV